MHFNTLTLLTLSSALAVSAAPLRRDLLSVHAGVDVGVTCPKTGKTHCPKGWTKSSYDARVCVEIIDKTTTRHSSSTKHHSTSSHKKSSTSHHGAISTHRGDPVHSSSKKHSSTTHHLPAHTTAKHHTTHRSSSSKKHSSSHHRTSTSHRGTATHKPSHACGADQRWNALLSLCVDINLGGVADIGAGVKIGNGGNPKAPLVSATAGVKIGGGDKSGDGSLLDLGAGVKIGETSGSAEGSGGATTQGNGNGKGSKGAKTCSDHDALLKLCVKVAGLADAGVDVGGKDLVDANANVAGIPVKAVVGNGKNGDLVDASVGNVVKASVGGKGGKDGNNLVDADVAGVKVGAGLGASTGGDKFKDSNNNGQSKKCPQGQLLHLGICVDADLNLLGLKVGADAVVAL